MSIDDALLVDLNTLPSGSTYEDRYSGYMRVFYDIAHNNSKEILVRHAPGSWCPLLEYLQCIIEKPLVHFDHDMIVIPMLQTRVGFDRTAVEVLCGFRPETTDALWKVDMQWVVAQNRRRPSENMKEFVVTTNGSFHRPEVLTYIRDVLPYYAPKKRKVVLVPCAADKPYPSKLHKEVLKRMPEDFYLSVATGVLGIVPQDLWDRMPYYDSGLPNEWRLQNILTDYLVKFPHDKVVVYADYYSLAIAQAVRESQHQHKTWFVNPVKFYADYVDLLAPERLLLLEKAFATE